MKLREKEQHLEEVTDTLKNFLSQLEDALLAKELYPYWVSAQGTKRPNRRVFFSQSCGFHGCEDDELLRFSDEKDEVQRVKKYSTFIQSLPKVNRTTLETLLQHLYRCGHTHTHTRPVLLLLTPPHLPGSTSAPT